MSSPAASSMQLQVLRGNLTHVVMPAQDSIEMVSLAAVRQRIRRALGAVPVAQRDILADALLDFAIQQCALPGLRAGRRPGC